MNKIKIISKDGQTKILLNNKEIEGVTFFNIEQSVESIPELHLIIRGDIDIETDTPIIIKDEDDYETSYQLARAISKVFAKNFKIDFKKSDKE